MARSKQRWVEKKPCSRTQAASLQGALSPAASEWRAVKKLTHLLHFEAACRGLAAQQVSDLALMGGAKCE